jgi:hypothetical protein
MGGGVSRDGVNTFFHAHSIHTHTHTHSLAFDLAQCSNVACAMPKPNDLTNQGECPWARTRD